MLRHKQSIAQQKLKQPQIFFLFINQTIENDKR